MSSAGWHKDSLVGFSFTVTDTTASYDILLNVRHTEMYPYQNLWLFLGGSRQLLNDTIEFYLADDRGVWLGTGHNGHITMPVLYEQGYHFSHAGEQTIYVTHGMRCDYLRGVTDVGIEIRKNEKQTYYGQE